MLGGKAENHRARARFVWKVAQGLGDRAHEAAVGMLQDEAQLGRGAQSGVGATRIVERPAHQARDEAFGKAGKWGAFGARQRYHDRQAVLQAVVE